MIFNFSYLLFISIIIRGIRFGKAQDDARNGIIFGKAQDDARNDRRHFDVNVGVSGNSGNDPGKLAFQNEFSVALNVKLCRLCNVKFRFVIEYENHFKDDHPNEFPHVCPRCPYKTWKKKEFSSHINRVHTGQSPSPSVFVKRKRVMTCETCGTEHGTAKDFDKHNSIRHKGEKMNKCGLCEARYSMLHGLKAHEMEKHGMHDAEFQCAFCKNYFTRSDTLEMHVGKCRERQTNKKIGYKKIDITGLEKFRNLRACYECGDKFENIQLLKRHFRSLHPELKGCLMCDVCRRSYNSTQALDKHVDKNHPDEGEPRKKNRMKQNYKCQYCGETFEGLLLFETHGITEHGKDQKTFHCGQCGDGFKRKRVLERHVIGIHRKVTVPCVHCGKHFRCEAQRRKHEKSCRKKMREKSRGRKIRRRNGAGTRATNSPVKNPTSYQSPYEGEPDVNDGNLRTLVEAAESLDFRAR